MQGTNNLHFYGNLINIFCGILIWNLKHPVNTFLALNNAPIKSDFFDLFEFLADSDFFP
jgi:hypothetical protein